MDDRDAGCLSGILKLAFLTWIFDWLQDNFGFGKGCSISGCGCGFIFLCLFLIFACSILFGTDWTAIRF
ncbi:MAG: hypothetical protein HUU23_02715 [Caldilineales bacterium]|nr:hypothetical protein [Caldilineales bacterium]